MSLPWNRFVTKSLRALFRREIWGPDALSD
jgi:hypothetical protein